MAVRKPLVLGDNGKIQQLQSGDTLDGVSGGGGGSLTVRDIDGAPSFAATIIEFTNGTVADQGGGVARITGLQGPQGIQGPTGATGPAGPNLVTIATATDLTGYLKGNGSTVSVLLTIPRTDITGLGTLATQNGTFSGTSSGTNTGDQDLSGLVPTTRTVNGQALSGNITVTAVPSGAAGGALAGTYPNPTQIITRSPFASSPADGTYVIEAKANFAFTINQIRGLKTSTGTLTLAVQINGTNVTGLSSLSVTTTPQDATATAANSVAVGDRVTFVVSGGSSPADLEFTLSATR